MDTTFTPDAQLSEMGEAALAYAACGWRVFPVSAGSKAPLYSKADGGNGHLDATADADVIRWWWTGAPSANVGLHVARSGLVVVDVDLYKPACGWEAFAREHGLPDLPDTLRQRSARGGVHFFYRAEPGDAFAGKLCAGAEIKSEGYVLLAPSSFEGKAYRFENAVEPAPAPDWIPRAKGRPKTTADKTAFNIDLGDDDLFEIDLGEAGIDEVAEALITSIRIQGVMTSGLAS